MREEVKLIFDTNKKNILHSIDKIYNIYERTGCNIDKVYENDKLVGLFIIKEDDNTVFFEEVCYNGINKFLFLKKWRKYFNKDKNCLAKVAISNKGMIKFLTNMGFNKNKYDELNYLMEYRR